MLPRHLIAAFVNSVEFIDVITFLGAALTTVLIREGRQAKTRGFKRRGVVGNWDGGGEVVGGRQRLSLILLVGVFFF